MAEGNASVLLPRSMKTEKVGVVSEDDPLLGECKGQMLLVGRLKKIRVGRRRNVDAAAAQALGQRRRTMLIQVEANCPRHRGHEASREGVKEVTETSVWR